jgi:hypothetical protein
MTIKLTKPQRFGSIFQTLRHGELSQLDSKLTVAFDNRVASTKDGAFGDEVYGPIVLNAGASLSMPSTHTTTAKSGAAIISHGSVSIGGVVAVAPTTGSIFAMQGASTCTINAAPIVSLSITNLGITSATILKWEPLLYSYVDKCAFFNAALSGLLTFYNVTTTTTASVVIPIRPINGSTLLSVVVGLKGAGGHGVFVPATGVGYPNPATVGYGMPLVQVLKTDSTRGLVSIIAQAYDFSQSTAAYQAFHTVLCTLNNVEVIDTSAFNYSVLVVSESGPNYVTGASISGVAWQVQTTLYDPAPRL